VIRVLLADDQELVRAGFRALVDAEDGVGVAGEASEVRFVQDGRPLGLISSS
jgi:DNA-binding NarL/FixJ family response regulator